MIVVKVELWSARTGEKTELARMLISNESEQGQHNLYGLHRYLVRVLRGRSAEAFEKVTVQRSGHVLNYPSERIHVWHLVYAALARLDYHWKDPYNK